MKLRAFNRVMKLPALISRLFALVAIAGLLLAPIARPAMAIVVDTPMSVDHATAAGSVGAEAMDDMPCCPGKPSLPDCSKDCPLMALCVTASLHFAPQTGLTVPRTIASIIFPGDFPELASVADAPPRRPPKA
jgi:hypothetical protein